MHSGPGNVAGIAEAVHFASTPSQSSAQGSSVTTNAPLTGPPESDGHFDFNDIDQAVGSWSGHNLFDLPFLEQFNPDVLSSWDDYLAFEFAPSHFSIGGPVPGHDKERRPSPTGQEDSGGASVNISRAPSPPNEASHEDRVPFAWSPSARRIAEPEEVRLDPQDPLLKTVDHHFRLNDATYERLKSSLLEELRVEGHLVLAPLRSFPSPDVVDVFASRFAKRFLPQAPIIHVPTFDINAELPQYLLVIIISIGATYCRRRNARRLAIVLQDWARCRLQLSIEADNALLRSPHTVYAAALICYAGIWCGNKRAYELAEAMRGSVVTWLRRLIGHHGQTITDARNENDELVDVWHAWAREDSLKRLQWMVFMLDFQYASLHNMPAMMSLTEVQAWDCPCDCEYWEAASAKQWKTLLGRANMPPTREFTLAVAPFVFADCPFSPLRSTNGWTAFLVLLTIAIQVQQEMSRAHFLQHLSIMASDESQEIETAIVEDQQRHSRLYNALNLWRRYYSQESLLHADRPASSFFAVASQDLYDLCRLQLRASISDLQDILGKNGLAGVQRARALFSRWLTRDQMSSHEAVCETITALTRHYGGSGNGIERTKRSSGSASAPYSSIYVFLAHAFLYACSSAASTEQRANIFGHVMSETQIDNDAPIFELLAAAFGSTSETGAIGKAVLRLGAQLLARFDHWACSLNLALLLHWRSKL
ncbi:Nicotinate catabolism cluster-specific transcription factor [Pseudocercospora fuligena]|uniref:Nicotinate catabolism cluster-specific transcription factor n=1 Tax=Pseudocercospora fuligena TaxID=685502 RepID=A0A8H6RSZ2_9PEZI|nr:Nicotinate catabolism cluster-specific transcription factor [Pseudocercospora fuligena]